MHYYISDGSIDPDIVKPRTWDLIYAVKYCYNIIYQPASFIRRSILKKVGWLDPEYKYADHELWLKIGLVGKIQYTPLHLAHGRIDRGQCQQLNMCKSIVDINRKFFMIHDLPYPFTLAKFRKRAMSNAYLRGSRFIWLGTRQPIESLQYVFKAFFIDPSNWYYILKTVIRNLLLPFIPFRWQRTIFKKINSLINLTSQRHK